MNKMRKIIVVSGPSGVGKTTLYKRVLENFKEHMGFSISATTRAPRNNEIDGRDYYFMSEEEFHCLVAEGEFIEWEQVHNNYYGTLKSEIYRIWDEQKDCLLDIDVRGGLRIQKIFEEKAFLIFIAPPSMEELENRLRHRGTNDEISLKNRLNNASDEMEQKRLYNIVLKNENIETSVKLLIEEISKLIL